MITLFGLFAEIERDLIAERTKAGLAAARAKGRLLGRPKGVLGTSKLTGREAEVRSLLAKTVSKASIAKFWVSSARLCTILSSPDAWPECAAWSRCTVSRATRPRGKSCLSFRACILVWRGLLHHALFPQDLGIGQGRSGSGWIALFYPPGQTTPQY
jgi:hypothetical protein